MKNPTILEGGIARVFSGIKKLFTRQSGSDDLIAWVPESDRQLTTKYITQNGVYRASDDGYYAYSSVTVNVSTTDSVTGRDPVTGEDVVVKPDPQTGELVETVVPSSIEVVTPPTFTGPYGDNAYISFDGIEVRAYKADGTVWEDENHPDGVIPFSELVFPVTTAQGGDEWSDGQGLNAMMLYYTPKPWIDWAGRESVVYVAQALGIYNGEEASYGSERTPATALITRYANTNYAVLVNGTSAGGGLYAKKEKSGSGLEQGWRGVGSAPGTSSKTNFEDMAWSEYLTNVPVSTIDPTTVDPANLHATQSLPVQWSRTGDGAVLETSFEILVAPPIYGGSEN